MSDVKLHEGSGLNPSNDGHELLAMVYRNEHNEVSYYSSDSVSVTEIDNGLTSITLIFVLSFVALVTISRRKTSL